MEKVNGRLSYSYKDRIIKGPDPCEGIFGKKPQPTECPCEGKGNITQIIDGESHAYQLRYQLQNKGCHLYLYIFLYCVYFYTF